MVFVSEWRRGLADNGSAMKATYNVRLRTLVNSVMLLAATLTVVPHAITPAECYSDNSYSEEAAEPLTDYYDDEQSFENSNKIIPWRQINFISPSQELAQVRCINVSASDKHCV